MSDKPTKPPEVRHEKMAGQLAVLIRRYGRKQNLPKKQKKKAHQQA